MVYEGVLEGKYVDLCSATVEDAEFTLAVRQKPEFINFIPKLDITLEQQKNWIEKQRETDGDYFFVIWDKKGNRKGTIGLYDVTEKTGETGRLTNCGNSFEAIESQLLCYDFAFDVLKLVKIKSEIIAANTSAMKFARFFGVNFDRDATVFRGETAYLGYNTPENYAVYREKIAKMIYR